MSGLPWELVCAECSSVYAGDAFRYRCDCGGTLDVQHAVTTSVSDELFDDRLRSKAPLDRSGVWRFRELVLPLSERYVCTRGEGNTPLYWSDRVARYVGLNQLGLKHEGENPTGSFKDRGMTTGMSMARYFGAEKVAVASTGNTSASAAAYAAMAGLESIVFIPDGQIAYGKLGQALAYGARTVQIAGDFDDAMRLVERMCNEDGIYLLNSVNPFRIEGQKAIGFELLQDLDWTVPDWIVLPGGNLGNNTALTKGMLELKARGIISKLPRVAVIQASGANPLHRAWHGDGVLRPVKADTIATAIKIGAPVSFTKSVRGLRALGGVVEQVTDTEILEAKAVVDAAGIGAEPASCATVAGVRKLVAAGTIPPDALVCGVLTGHVLKDPGVVVDYHTGKHPGTRANPPVRVAANLDAIRTVLSKHP